MYNADTERSWNMIERSIAENSHLIMTYANKTTRASIVNQKINDLLIHETIELQIHQLYKLSKDDKETYAIYLGKHWAMLTVDYNDIPEMRRHQYMYISDGDLREFYIVSTTNDQIKNRIMTETVALINPEDLELLKMNSNAKFEVLSSSERNSIDYKDISHNWQKVFTYHYYKDAILDTRLPLKEFKDIKTIQKLATARQDTEVLSALA
jgi:hypothetical protein